MRVVHIRNRTSVFSAVGFQKHHLATQGTEFMCNDRNGLLFVTLCRGVGVGVGGDVTSVTRGVVERY